MRTAVLGTGIMGLPMARNMARAGLEVVAWNRTRERAEPLIAEGIELADDPRDAASGADVVLTMLSDADAVLETMELAIESCRSATWVQMSTVGLDGTERCAELATGAAVELVDAPVLGTKAPAEQGELIVLASGPAEALERCVPIFDAVGQRTLNLGPAGTGTRMKLVLNAWVLAQVEGLAETIALAEALNINPRRFLETIAGGPIDSGYAQLKGKMMIERDFAPSFPLRHAAKDAALAIAAAERHQLPLPLLESVREQLDLGVGSGHGDEDMAATIRSLGRAREEERE
jgi:3-hydroxyisobutyrate dehydrogenase